MCNSLMLDIVALAPIQISSESCAILSNLAVRPAYRELRQFDTVLSAHY